jgi:hypothetical protein
MDLAPVDRNATSGTQIDHRESQESHDSPESTLSINETSVQTDVAELDPHLTVKVPSRSSLIYERWE